MNKNTIEYKLNSRNNNFDFLRFLAAYIVMYSHSFQLTGLFNKEPLINFTKGYLYFGGLSVTIFFIISGFLITSSYHRSKSLKQYLMARVLRIYPALIGVVFITVFLFGPFLTAGSFWHYFSDRDTYFYLINSLSFKMFYTLPGMFSKNPLNVINGPFWSLPYELSCYCLVALVGLVISKKYNYAFGILCIAILFYSCIGIDAWKNIIEFSVFFACGAALYLLRSKIVLNHFVAFLCFAFLICILHTGINKHLKDLSLIITLPYILIDIVFIKCSLNKFSKYGDFSYGIYIWGWLVQQIVFQLLPISRNPFPNFIISSMLTLIIAMLSWHLLEKKFLRFKSKFIK